MRWIEQKGSNNCGQIAVAVLADVELEIIERMVGHKHGTNTHTLVRVLRELGFKCRDDCRVRTRPEMGLGQVHDTFGVLRLRNGEYIRRKRHGWHWVAIDGPRIWDGVNGTKDGTVLWPAGYRLTSFLPVER